jgi:photosynthetic reaction center H subunit
MIFSGEFVNGIDLVDVCLWAFMLFFVWLIYYLQREGMREGYPLEEEPSGRTEPAAFLFVPPKKTFKLPNGRGTIEMTYGKADTREIAVNRTAPWPGSPFEPSGDPMLDGVGPASYAMRADVPDLNWDGSDRIAPYRLNPEYTVSPKDIDPRGLPVIGADGNRAGVVVDLWVDRAEAIIRYLEVEVIGFKARGTVLLPVPFANISKSRKQVEVTAINTEHFAAVPRTKSPDRITRLEEDIISGYYGGGTLYANPKRQEPWL